MQKILIIRLSSLGDIIHTYPMIHDIKSNLPNCTIDWLVDERFAGLVKLNPLVDNIVSIPLRYWKMHKLKFVYNLKNWKNELKCLSYDYIIDSQGLLKSAILSKVFNGVVHGFGRHSIREKLASVLYNKRYETGRNIQAITKNRLLASLIFGYTINQGVVNFGLNKSVYPQLDLPSKYVIFFHATSKESKKLPLDYWVNLGHYLLKQDDLQIILPFGNEEEKNLSIIIKQKINSSKVLVPDTTFDFMMLSRLICNSQFIFGVDTGLIHLANALNKRLIAIYVDTKPTETGIFETNIAKNIGNKDNIPKLQQIIDLYETIRL